MGLHNVAVEKQIKPVCITELSLLQVLGHCRLSERQFKITFRLVIAVHQSIHLSIESGRRGVGHLRELQPSLGLHLLVDTHLLLRVRDVIVAIAGLQAVGELTGVVDGAVACTTLLRGDNHHTRHGACTINRSSRTVLQHLERLDIIGIQASNSIGNQRCGITTRQVISIHVHGILHDDAIDHPEG